MIRLGPATRFVTEAEVGQALTMADAIAALDAAFRSQAAGRATNVPRRRDARPGVALNSLTAISDDLDAVGIKTYPIVRTDVTVGASFTMLVYRISTGGLRGILEANRLGQIRTGAASAVAARCMVRPGSRRMALFGAGWQAESQLAALACVLPALAEVTVVSRSLARAEAFCQRLAGSTPAALRPSTDAEAAVRQADIVTTATGSTTPVFDGAWLAPGTHVNAIGSNYAGKQEIDIATVRRSARIVADDIDVACIESGDLLVAVAARALRWEDVHGLAAVVAGQVPGRAAAEEITLFESHGMGLEDLAAACRVLDLIERQEGAA